jgi:hypothetical protein
MENVVIKLFAAQGAAATRPLTPADLHPIACKIVAGLKSGGADALEGFQPIRAKRDLLDPDPQVHGPLCRRVFPGTIALPPQR